MTETPELVQSSATLPSPVLRMVGRESVRVWGLTSTERLRRMAGRLGLEVGDWDGSAGGAERVALFRRDVVMGADLLKALLSQESGVLLDEDGAAAIAAIVPAARAAEAAAMLEAARWVPDEARMPFPAIQPAALVGTYDKALRKRKARPIARLVDAENRPRTERALYTGAYKGVTDIVTKYLWPYPAYSLTRIASRLRISPNAVTLTSIALTVAATWLFAEGAFGWGLLCAWSMALLDTVDGKLARVTVTSSPVGNVLDHGTDLVHPPFWYGAWLYGLAQTGQMEGPWGWIAWLTIGGYVLTRLQEGLFLARHRMQIHVWRAGDALFRLVSARRNPHLIVLTLFALAGAPYLAIAAVAVWTGITIAVHMAQILQAEAARRKGPITSWMEP